MGATWFVFASTQCPLRVWLGAFSDAAEVPVLLAAFSQQNRGFITVANEEAVVLSNALDGDARTMQWSG